MSYEKKCLLPNHKFKTEIQTVFDSYVITKK